MKSTPVYISTGCNRIPNCVSWGNNNSICFGSCNSVAIYNPVNATITDTCCYHTARVNCVKWITEDEFISGSSDHSAVIWKKDSSTANFTVSTILKGHTDIVTSVDAVYVANKDSSKVPYLLIASTSVDSTIRIWERFHEDQTPISKIVQWSGLCTSLCLFIIPEKNIPILAIGADDAKIHLFANLEGQYTHHHSLIGHENWVRSIDVITQDNGDILLASGAQDCFIRIWRLSKRYSKTEQHIPTDVTEDIKLEERVFSIKEGNEEILHLATAVDSILSGHEGWVYQVCWQKAIFNDNGSVLQPLYLLSASLDKTMVVWSPSKEDGCEGIWMENVRVGEVGGNTLGFYGCQFSPDGQSILAHGYNGSFHLWHKANSDSWHPGVTVGGHYDEVTDLAWEPEGNFFITVSADQTTRIHAPCISNNNSILWHEIARPQSHGHAVQCLAILPQYRFASGAEEKVIRIFQGTSNFIENFVRLSGIKEIKTCDTNMPYGAVLPALGLSNKAVYRGANPTREDDREAADSEFTPLTLTEPPTEENLIQNTLWPEIEKLYGHGFEIYSLAVTSDGSVLASSCRASSMQQAGIIIWDTTTWRQIEVLEGHELTVTQLAFSPNDKYLLSVSRDRRWCLFERQNSGFSLVQTSSKKGLHTRIIWCCSWTHDSKYFSTGSRDGKVAVWSPFNLLNGDKETPASDVLQIKESVTSMSFARSLLTKDGSYTLGLGLEDGKIFIYNWKEGNQNCWSLSMVIKNCDAHHLTVKRLAFQPETRKSSKTEVLLASAGSDNAVKIHAIPRFNI